MRPVLMRQGIAQGWGSLKSLDATHLGTAQRMNVVGFLTCCQRLQVWDGRVGFSVSEPQLKQTTLNQGVSDLPIRRYQR